jgi:hypothetical protein
MALVYGKPPHFALEKTWDKKTGKFRVAEQQFLCNKIEPSAPDVANSKPSFLLIVLPLISTKPPKLLSGL